MSDIKKKKKKKAAAAAEQDELTAALDGVKAKKKTPAAKKNGTKKPAGKKVRSSAKRGKHNTKKAKRNGGLYGTVCAVLLVFCVCLIVSFAIRSNAYSRFSEMRAYLDRDTFYPGTTVDGVKLDGMTLSDALDAFRSRETELASSRDMLFDLGEGESVTYTALDIGYSTNYEAVLRGAWKLGRSGSLEKRYEEALQGCEYTVSRGVSENALKELVSNIADGLNVEPKDAYISQFIPNKGKFVIESEVNGIQVDKDELYAQAKNALRTGDIIEVNKTEIGANVTKAQLNSEYGQLSYAVTNASSSSSNRLNNIRLACASINGTCLQPGDEFSFNEVVGKRTAAAGYKKAGVFLSGSLGEEIGGGICQVATTLFNAAVKADMQITERHPHSRPVTYIDKGKDATVSWGIQDLKFVNTSDKPVYIVAGVSEDLRVRIFVFGSLRTDGLTISVVPITKQVIEPGADSYVYTNELPTGVQRIKDEARKGYRLNTYKAWTDANGNVVKKELLCTSYYAPAGAVIEVGN